MVRSSFPTSNPESLADDGKGDVLAVRLTAEEHKEVCYHHTKMLLFVIVVYCLLFIVVVIYFILSIISNRLTLNWLILMNQLVM